MLCRRRRRGRRRRPPVARRRDVQVSSCPACPAMAMVLDLTPLRRPVVLTAVIGARRNRFVGCIVEQSQRRRQLQQCSDDSKDIVARPRPTSQTIRYDTKSYFNVRSTADVGQVNLPRGTNN